MARRKRIRVSNYELFRKEKGISNPEMISEIKKFFPMFGKVAASFVNNPNDYGVQLHPAAEKILAEKFGSSDYLSTVQKERKKKPSASSKTRAVMFPESDYGDMLKKAKEAGFETVFEYILSVIKSIDGE